VDKGRGGGGSAKVDKKNSLAWILLIPADVDKGGGG
jgi:hypothetical protein